MQQKTIRETTEVQREVDSMRKEPFATFQSMGVEKELKKTLVPH